MCIKSKKYIKYIIYLYSAIFSLHLSAAELDYSIGLGTTSYENVNLISDPVENELSTSVRTVVSYTEDTVDHVSFLDLDLEYLNYKKNQLTDQVNGSLTAQSTIIVTPSFFEWHFSDVFSRVTINPLASPSLANLINTNAFLTGPNFYFRLNKNNNLNLTLRAENYIFEEFQLENSDNNRLTSLVSFVHSLNETSELSLNYQYSIVDYDNEDINSNFDRVDAFFNFDYRRSVYRINLEAGYTNIIFNDQTIEDVNQPRYSLSMEAQRTRTSRVLLRAYQITTDTSTSLLNQLNVDGNDSQLSATANSDLYLDTGGDFIYRNSSPASNFTFQLGYIETRYNTQELLNVDIESASLQYESLINTTSGIVFSTRFAKNTYQNILPERLDDDVLYSIAYRLRLRRSINLQFSIEDETRDSTVDARSYEDFRIRVSLEYVSI